MRFSFKSEDLQSVIKVTLALLRKLAGYGGVTSFQVCIEDETKTTILYIMFKDGEVNGNVNCANTQLWPTRFLQQDDPPPKKDGTVGLIILNSPISQYQYLVQLYDNADFRICADGGANRLHDVLTAECPELTRTEALQIAPPDLIHGDLDSLDDTVRKRYGQISVEISKDPDQYSTDFGKAVKKTLERLPKVQDILVLGSIGGRLDQGIGLLGEMYREQRVKHPNVRFWLFSEASVSTILSPGSTILHTPLKEGLIERNIGILPVYGPAVISTKGCEWDVQDWPTEMGGQMSTSNHIVADRITVTTNNDVLFTVERAVDR